MPTDPTYLGTVEDVQGATVRVVLDASALSGLAFIQGHGYRIGQIGSFVRIPLGFTDLYGIVSQVGASAVPEKVAGSQPYGNRWMTVQLVGEGLNRGEFRRGLSQYPTVSDTVHLLTEQDLAKIYGRRDTPNFVKVGHLASAESIPALVDVDKLVTRHSAVVGSTGSGKSTTVAGLLAALSEPAHFASARILVLDIHGEYRRALEDRANVFCVNPNPRRGEKPLFVPYWAMTFEELVPAAFGIVSDGDRNIFLDKIMALKLTGLETQPRAGVQAESLTVDTPVPFSIHGLWLELHKLAFGTHHAPRDAQNDTTYAYELDGEQKPVQPGDAFKVIPPKFLPSKTGSKDEQITQSAAPISRRCSENLAARLRDPRFDFLFRPGKWTPDPTKGVVERDLDKLLEDWLGSEKPISILDLSGIPSSILTSLIGVLLRVIYDALFWGRNLPEGGRERPLLIVLEEAHAYLSQGDDGPAAMAVKRIVKEGRKYGIGSMVVSQRPAEIDTTILSQCGTIFAMRLANATDRSHVKGAASDHLEGLFDMLPILRTGEAIIVGEAVRLPVRTLIDPPAKDRRPDSTDPLIHDPDGPGGWDRPRLKSSYDELVALWRKQMPRSERNIETNEETSNP